jgi:hypothetical protein
MTEWQFDKARNFPLNRDGETITVQASEGDLVGLTENGDGEAELVSADAASGTQQPAMGVLMEDIRDPTNVSVSGYETAYIEQNQLRRQMREETDYTFVGEEGTYVFNGIMLANVDGDTDLTPGEVVYLGVGGGFTQTAPSGGGEVVQVVGVATDANQILLDVDFDYSTV